MVPSPRIAIANVHNNEVVPHSLVVLDGVIEGFVALALDPRAWFIHASIDAVRGAFWPVNATGKFKATVLLPTPGQYTVTLRLQSHVTHEIAIEYQPVVSRYVVRFYYMKGSDASPYDGFDAPPGTNKSDEEAMQKIRFNALLLQTAMAEMFVHAGLPRKTFSLEYAVGGLPQVHFLRTSFTTNEARTIHDQELIRKIEDDIVAQGFNAHDVVKFKHEVILGCSTYNPATKGPIGHSALGGGMVGIFGSCGLHTWPKHLGELSACLLNNQRVDTNYLWDDSAYRGTFWANFSTGIGAFIHEMGHTFGLGHSTSGIMARGFDDMNRLFCAFEADHRRHEPAFYENHGDGRLLLNHTVLKNVTEPDGAHWNIASALQLVHCPWVSGKPKESPCGPLVCWSCDKLGPVGWVRNDDGTPRPFHTSPPKEPLAAIRIKAGTYVDDVTCYTRREYAALPAEKLRCRLGTHWLVLDDDEIITHVEVRSGAWIDGIRIFTNRQTTRWFGGYGGDLHLLRPNDGYIVSGFFGVRGSKYVGRLGVYCAPHSVPSIYQPSNLFVNFDPMTTQRVGRVDCSDCNSAESVIMTFENQVGAIAVKCSKDYIERVRVVSREVHERATKLTDSRVYEMDEQVFALRAGEYVQMVCVRSGKHIEALQFHTNQRASLWFGGKGSSSSVIQELAPSANDIGVCGFSGGNDKNRKERLDLLSIYGAKCIFDEVATNSPSALILSLPRVGPVGEGKGDGQQRAFLSAPSCGDLGAVCVEFGEYISGVLACSILDVEKPELQPHAGRQVFVFEAGEYITQVDVHCAWWVDGIRLHTNKRTSPHYGGVGGSLQVLRPLPGYKVQGVFGSKGDCFVGAIGLLCAPIDPASVDVAHESQVAVPETFAMKATTPPKNRPGAGVAHGVLIGVQGGVVQYVHSFDTDSMRHELLDQLQVFASVGASVYSFTLHPGEWLIQIDASLDNVNDSVTGICLHTTTRCSSWYGTYDDESIHFVAAPTGHVIKSVVGEASAATLHDIVGEFAIPEMLPFTFAGVNFDEASRTAVKVLEDDGSYDIRLQSQSSYGIEAMFISKIHEDQDLDQHAWRWKSTTPPPLRVCLPQRMLEHHLAPNGAGKASKQLLFSGYTLGAIDVGGAFTSSRSTAV